jgi:hypothetical protein
MSFKEKGAIPQSCLKIIEMVLMSCFVANKHHDKSWCLSQNKLNQKP